MRRRMRVRRRVSLPYRGLSFIFKGRQFYHRRTRHRPRCDRHLKKNASNKSTFGPRVGLWSAARPKRPFLHALPQRVALTCARWTRSRSW